LARVAPQLGSNHQETQYNAGSRWLQGTGAEIHSARLLETSAVAK